MPLRILIADDHKDFREVTKVLLETNASWQVCGEASNGLEAVEMAAELKPDVIILDVSMPRMDGLQAASLISTASPEIPILIYTNYAVPPETKLEARKYGVREILNKETSPDQLIAAVESLQRQRIEIVPQQMAESRKIDPSPMLPSDPTDTSVV